MGVQRRFPSRCWRAPMSEMKSSSLNHFMLIITVLHIQAELSSVRFLLPLMTDSPYRLFQPLRHLFLNERKQSLFVTRTTPPVTCTRDRSFKPYSIYAGVITSFY